MLIGVAYIAVKTRETRLSWICQCLIRGSERGEKTDEEMNRQSNEYRAYRCVECG